MKKYSVKIFGKDFRFSKVNYNAKGSRVKKLVIDNHGQVAFFKYEGTNYNTSESCSEKMCYEIAKILGYSCARIELARDDTGKLGILNYLFIDFRNTEHTDIISYLNVYDGIRSNFYTVSNIKLRLDRLDKSLFKGFIRIMIFDALVGEQDRHEENWGVQIKDGSYSISPLYDNGCSLLKEFRNESFAEYFYSGKKSFDAYIKRSKTVIYQEDGSKKYKHFELIKYLNEYYYSDVQEELNNLNKLTDNYIKEIVYKIPDDCLTDKHKEYIIIYLIKRRDILLNMLSERGESHEE